MKRLIMGILALFILPIIPSLLANKLSEINILDYCCATFLSFIAQPPLIITLPIWSVTVLPVILLAIVLSGWNSKIHMLILLPRLPFLRDRKPFYLTLPQDVLKTGYIGKELRLLLLGYQNDGGLLSYKKRLCSKDYEPGTFTLSEIAPSSFFMQSPTSLEKWLEASLDAEIKTLIEKAPRLLKRHSLRELKDAVTSILELRTDVGHPLKADIWYQEYSDILRRIILFVSSNNPDIELELFANLTIERKKFVLKVLSWLEKNKTPSLHDWLYLSIAAGLMGVDEKSAHTAASEIDRKFVIPLNSKLEEESVSIVRVGEAVYRLAHTGCRIDSSDWFFQYMNISKGTKVKLLSFPDDYIETIFLLKYYQELILRYDNIEIDCVPRMIRCGNDARYHDFGDLLKYFPVIRKSQRFRVHDTGPKLGTVNIAKLHPDVMALIEDCDFLDVRGARNYEMMQGVNKDAFFGFMVCRDFSEATIGLFSKDTPLIYMRQPAGERSFSGFRQRHTRKKDGKMLCLCAAIDKKEKWEGGHLARYAVWSDEEKDRYATIQRFYSKGAIDFHKKYGDLLEIEVRHYLEYLYGRILVVGCGSGKEVGYLYEQGHEAIGIDFSVEAINLARNRYPHLWDMFYVEDFYNTIHFKEGYFDCIVANAVLVHMLSRSDIESIFNQFNRRLSENGKLYIRLIEKTGKQEEYDTNLFNAQRWFVYYTMEEVCKMGELCGFMVIKRDRYLHMQHQGVYWNNILFEKT